MPEETLNLKEDSGGVSPPDVSGEREDRFFNLDAANHDLKARKLQMGLFGILGPPETAPNHIAFLAMIMGVLIATGCLFASVRAADVEAKFLQSFAERALAFSATCLGFIFGRSTAPKV